MAFGRRIPANFYISPSPEVARALIGCVLVHRLSDGEELSGQIVETEAYRGDGSDPSAHSHRGPTPRNASMFGPPGRLYVYRIYGLHTCINLVCEPEGHGAAVLLRAVEPLVGVDRMRAQRGLGREARGRIIASGPGRLAQAFGFGLGDDGKSATAGDIRIHRLPQGEISPEVRTGPRIGISRATHLPYRFFAASNPWVSGKGIPGKTTRNRSQGQKRST